MTERPTPRRLEDRAGPASRSSSSPSRRESGAAQGGGRPASGGSAAAAKSPISPSYGSAAPKAARPAEEGEPPRDRGLRRAMFLAELAEARELRRRVAPRRARAAELHARLLRTFRY